jgi:hypothetical protein
MKPSIKTTAVFVIGFLLGGAATAFGIHHCFMKCQGKGSKSEFILRHLTSKLKLDAGQKDKVALLLKEQEPKMETLHQETATKFKALRNSFNTKLKPILNTDQQKKLDEMTAKWDSRADRKNCRPYGCGGPKMGMTPAATAK